MNNPRTAPALFCLALAALQAGSAAVAAPPNSKFPMAVLPQCSNLALPAAILDNPAPPTAAPPAASAAGTAGAAPTPLPGAPEPSASPPSLRVIATGGAAVLHLAVADTPNARDLGLMCVLRLRPQHGMIFVFPQAAIWEFWMKRTLVPLDMVWLDDAGNITTLKSNVPASDLDTPDARVARRRGFGRFVIELSAGEAVRQHLKIGSNLRLPPLQASE